MRNSSNFRRQRDKTAIAFIAAFALGLLITAASVWAIVEFILYLTKDDPFNWWSIGTIVIIAVLYLINLYRMMTSNY